MASVTTNFHFYNDDNLPVKVDVREDGDYWVTVGDWPSSVTMFLTEEQAETLRKAIHSAQDDAQYSALEDDVEQCGSMRSGRYSVYPQY